MKVPTNYSLFERKLYIQFRIVFGYEKTERKLNFNSKEAIKKCYERYKMKNANKIKERHKTYYCKNSERVKAKQRERYRKKKNEELREAVLIEVKQFLSKT